MRNRFRGPSSSRWIAAIMLLVVAAGVAILVHRGLEGREDQPVRFGVLADHPVGVVRQGEQVCQGPIDLDKTVSSLGLAVDSAANGGPALDVTVRDTTSGRVERRARIDAGYRVALKGFLPVPLTSPLSGNRTISVCARNLGRRRLTLVGKEGAYYSKARVGSKVLVEDWAVFFPPTGDERRNYLQMTPDMVRRASVLRPGLVTPAFYLLLAFVLFVIGPVLLWRAVVSASVTDE